MGYYCLRFATPRPSIRVVILSRWGSMLDSSNAAELLHGLTLSQAFHKYVSNDPEVASLAAAAIRSDQEHEVIFRDGRYPGLHVRFTWPLDISADDLAFQFILPRVFYLEHYASTEAPDVVKKVCAMMAD